MADDRLQRAMNNQFSSEFLLREQENVAFDNHNKLGKPLTMWEKGDTILSVTMKRMKQRIIFFLDPDTYTKKQKKSLIKQGQLYNNYLILGALILMTPLAIYVRFVSPRVSRARREYYMHQYDKLDLLQRTLGVNMPKIDLKSMKNILHKKEE